MQSLRTNLFALTFCLCLSSGCNQSEVGASLEPPEPLAAPVQQPLVDLRKPAVIVEEVPVIPVHPQKRPLGSFAMTYYWITSESETARGRQPIKDKNCKQIAKVSKSFRKRLALEGSGQLKDGRVVSTAGPCKCGPPCFWVLDKNHRWGSGVSQRPLSPFRSIAVDPKEIRIGTSLYVAELDGLTMPGSGDEGGFVHDGCVVADDRGGGVRGKQIDFFAVRKSHYLNFSKRHKLRRVRVYRGGERCKAHARKHESRVAAIRGSI